MATGAQQMQVRKYLQNIQISLCYRLQDLGS
jgi:hypothetical protein